MIRVRAEREGKGGKRKMCESNGEENRRNNNLRMTQGAKAS